MTATGFHAAAQEQFKIKPVTFFDETALCTVFYKVHVVVVTTILIFFYLFGKVFLQEIPV